MQVCTTEVSYFMHGLTKGVTWEYIFVHVYVCACTQHRISVSRLTPLLLCVCDSALLTNLHPHIYASWQRPSLGTSPKDPLPVCSEVRNMDPARTVDAARRPDPHMKVR